jgi:allantoinase
MLERMRSAAYVSERVALADGVRPACVVVRDGVIAAVLEADALPEVDVRYELGRLALLPGLVDTHVHVNEPGRTEWEGFQTATRAAAAGGVTTIVDMPLNCLPETTTVEALEEKRAAALGKCCIDWRSWGGAVGTGGDGNQPHLVPLAQAGVAGFKCFLLYPGCDGLGLIDEASLRTAMPLIARTGLPLLVHAELPGPLLGAAAGLEDADWNRYETYLASRPDEAELEAIALMIGLCRESGTRVHLVHLATALALPMLRAAKAEGLPITVETCPHYLHFASESVPDGATEFKCAPPIRSAANREGLWGGLAAGVIDLVASDHSPCPPGMKAGSFLTAWGGIASLSLGISVMWTGMQARGMGLGDLTELMCGRPSQMACLRPPKGLIAEGFDADLVVFDPEAEFVVERERLYFRHAVSPYVGERLRGVVRRTILRGVTVFEDGEFLNVGTGQEVLR